MLYLDRALMRGVQRGTMKILRLIRRISNWLRYPTSIVHDYTALDRAGDVRLHVVGTKAYVFGRGYGVRAGDVLMLPGARFRVLNVGYPGWPYAGQRGSWQAVVELELP